MSVSGSSSIVLEQFAAKLLKRHVPGVGRRGGGILGAPWPCWAVGPRIRDAGMVCLEDTTVEELEAEFERFQLKLSDAQNMTDGPAITRATSR